MRKISYNVLETNALARFFCTKLVKKSMGSGTLVVALTGELGAGKTLFVRAFAKALGIQELIPSPTFLILRQYEIKNDNFDILIHIDAYRINSASDLEELGITDMLRNPRAIVMIEWAERVSSILQKRYHEIHIDHIAETTRAFTFTEHE